MLKNLKRVVPSAGFLRDKTKANEGTGRLRVNSVKVCVLRPKNRSRTIIFTKYVYFLLKRTVDKNFKKLT